MKKNPSHVVETVGVVQEIIDEVTFKVKLADETEIIATISRSANLDFGIYIGEEVPLHRSPYDLSRARINFRYWVRNRKRPT